MEKRRTVSDAKFNKNTVRALLAERKADFKEFVAGDWVIRQRSKRHELEVPHDGPSQFVETLKNRTYTLKSLSGKYLKNNYHADVCTFPGAESTLNGQPVESPSYYASKRLLKQHRDLIGSQADLPVDPVPAKSL